MFSRITFFLIFQACLPVLICTGLALILSDSASAREEKHPEYSISITFDTGQRSMTGTASITLPPDVPLNLYCGNLVITGVLLDQSGRTPMQLRPSSTNTLDIAATDVDQTIFVSWSLRVPEQVHGDNLISPEGITLAGLWHPVPDIDMLYQLEAKLPDNFTAISEGETVYCKDKANNRFLTSDFPYPVRSIHFVAGPYTVKYKKMANGISLAAFFFPEDLHLADDYLARTASYIKRYEKLIGPYPYTRYSIVENRLPTGYGMPTFTLLGQVVVRLPFIKDTSLGHEVLHSWFGNSVHVSDSGGNWSEGLTTYLADQLYAEDRGEGAEYRKNQLLRYDAFVHGEGAIPIDRFANASDSQPMARAIRAVGYDKASMVFHMLRKRLGDKLFFEGLQNFYRTRHHQKAGWEDIEDIFTAVADEDLTLFFEQWLTRPDIPKLRVGYVDISQEKGSSVITFTVTQASVEPYELDLPVAVQTRTAETFQTLRIKDRTSEVKITVDNLPLSMTIDSDYDLMRTLQPQEKPPVWSQFMGAPNKTVVLPPADKEMIYAPLVPLLENMGCKTVSAEELTAEELNNSSLLFLDTAPQSLGLFADPQHNETGFTLDVRSNPLNPDQVAVLVTSASTGDTSAVLHRLSHYGKYSFLYFENGRALQKRTVQTDQGINVELFPEPKGIRVADIQSFESIIKELQKDRVVYVGEVHTDMGSHILQLQIIQALFEKNPNLAIGMEMFPRSSQAALDSYINGTITTEKDFLKESGYFDVWGYDYRLYREIIGYARKNHIPLVGLNIEKSIVDQVFKEGGLDGLDEKQTGKIPTERKLDIPGYRERLSQAFSSHQSVNFANEKLGGFMQAQSIWDESMAETIVDYLRDNPDRRMVVIAGNGHVYKETGIPPRAKRRLDVSQSVVSSTSYGNTGLETGYKMDYLLYTLGIKLKPAPKIGVVLKTEKISEDDDLTRLRVLKISPHGKAGEGGIEKNDILLSVDGRDVHDITDVRISIMDKHPGDTVQVRVLREHVLMPDEELEQEVELSAPMNMGGMPPTHPK